MSGVDNGAVSLLERATSALSGSGFPIHQILSIFDDIDQFRGIRVRVRIPGRLRPSR